MAAHHPNRTQIFLNNAYWSPGSFYIDRETFCCTLDNSNGWCAKYRFRREMKRDKCMDTSRRHPEEVIARELRSLAFAAPTQLSMAMLEDYYKELPDDKGAVLALFDSLENTDERVVPRLPRCRRSGPVCHSPYHRGLSKLTKYKKPISARATKCFKLIVANPHLINCDDAQLIFRVTPEVYAEALNMYKEGLEEKRKTDELWERLQREEELARINTIQDALEDSQLQELQEFIDEL